MVADNRPKEDRALTQFLNAGVSIDDWRVAARGYYGEDKIQAVLDALYTAATTKDGEGRWNVRAMDLFLRVCVGKIDRAGEASFRGRVIDAETGLGGLDGLQLDLEALTSIPKCVQAMQQVITAERDGLIDTFTAERATRSIERIAALLRQAPEGGAGYAPPVTVKLVAGARIEPKEQTEA